MHHRELGELMEDEEVRKMNVADIHPAGMNSVQKEEIKSPVMNTAQQRASHPFRHSHTFNGHIL